MTSKKPTSKASRAKRAASRPDISVVIAAYNRPDSLRRLLDDLAQQTLPPDRYEIVVVDDGSREPIADKIGQPFTRPSLRVIRQENAGQGAARHRGIGESKGDIVVIVDDDMRVPPHFLEGHQSAHQAGCEVALGLIKPADPAALPLHERFHTRWLETLVHEVAQGKRSLSGVAVATGNLSLRRARYDEVGGFDTSLRQSEDRDLGIRLELAGARLGVAPRAESLHDSDHANRDAWLRRAENYGRWDSRIARKYPSCPEADPWSFLGQVNLISRPIFVGVIALPAVAPPLAKAAMVAAEGLDKLGQEGIAIKGTIFAYGVRYFEGVRLEAGSLAMAWRGFQTYRSKSKDKSNSRESPMSPSPGAFRRFASAVSADYALLRQNQQKYHGHDLAPWKLPIQIAQKIGLQMTAATRVMHLVRDLRVPFGGEVMSRMIRHVYGAEIHFNADIAPGLSIVHGNGLVVSHRAKVGRNCILFHNVTLGESRDSRTGEVGAPVLEDNVHVGPGAVLLGPITIGTGSKIMANAVVTESVPPHSVVRAPAVEIVKRPNKSQTEEA